MRYSKTLPASKRLAVGVVAAMALLGIVSGCSSDSSDTPAVNSAAIDRNSATVRTFYDLAANKHKPQEAADTYLGEVYIQHNPQVANGKAGFVELFDQMVQQHPQLTIEFKHIVAQGDLVSVFSLMKTSTEDRGTVVADLFRLQDGKIVEHWDALQPVAETSANGNPQV